MAKATQEGRLLHLTTPLGPDYLLIDRLEGKEGLSELFEFHLDLLFDEEEDGNYIATPVDVQQLLGQTVKVTITQEDGGSRNFIGMVNHFSHSGRRRRYSHYKAKIVPHVWRLTKSVNSRIFQHTSVPDILREVFDGYEMRFETQRDYKPRNFCVQYQETDFDFASRLMEEEGIYYYFEHADDTDKMVLRDNYQSPEDCPSKNEIPFFNEQLISEGQWESSIKAWLFNYQITSGKQVLWDRNFQLPNRKLEVEQQSIFNIGNNQDIEIYNYPAGYARKYDDIDRSGGERDDLSNVFQDNTKTVENRMLSLDSEHKIISSASNCSSLTPGYRFQLKNHPNDDFNIQYVVRSVEHMVDQNPFYLITDEENQAYENKFTCIPHGSGHPEFRPAQKTPKPVMMGTQTAIVTGPGGEEIFTDKYGRVKVQFHWHREGNFDGDSSCWVQVAQMWASNGWGSMFIPRIGMEVVVHFINGDPDHPIITGCVYNPETMPAYTLPDEKTKSGIKSNSTTGGNGFNEFRFEDKAGEEQIFVHGEKDLDVRIKNDAKEIIKNDRHLIVENNQHEKVNTDKHLKVGGDKNEEVSGTTSEKAQNIQLKAEQNYAVDATSEVHIKGGTNTVVESNTSLTIKAGGSFIHLSSAGVSISGTMVNINSGGMAGSGSGCSPTAPTEPQEADDAIAGTAVGARTNPPPPPPSNYSQMATALSGASQNGTPFVGV